MWESRCDVLRCQSGSWQCGSRTQVERGCVNHLLGREGRSDVSGAPPGGQNTFSWLLLCFKY